MDRHRANPARNLAGVGFPQKGQITGLAEPEPKSVTTLCILFQRVCHLLVTEDARTVFVTLDDCIHCILSSFVCYMAVKWH